MFSTADTLSMVFSGLSGLGDGLYKRNDGNNEIDTTTNYLVYDKETNILCIFLNRLESPVDTNGDLIVAPHEFGPEASLKLILGEYDPTLLMNLSFWVNEIEETLDNYPYLTPNSATNRCYETLIDGYSVVIDDVGVYVRKDGDNEPCMGLILVNL